MYRLSAEPRERVTSALAVAAIHALLAYALLRGLGVSIEPAVRDAQQMIEVALDLPPPPATPASPDTRKNAVARPKDAEGAASPANRKDTPTEIVAPQPVIILPPPPPPLPAAPVAGLGNAPAAGAAILPGPGTGAGGIGTGLGSGLNGNGTGGAGGGRGIRARLIRGGIDPQDYPQSAVDRRAQGVTYIAFTVLPNGRVRKCSVTRSSGHRDLDAATCPLLERRLRYRPARDAAGRPVAEAIRGQQDWRLGPEPPVREYDAELVPDDDLR